MKKLFSLILVLSLSWNVNSYAQSMISISQYLKDNINYLKDPITITYLMNRCSAVYIYASVVTNKKMPDISNNFVNAAIKMHKFSLVTLIKEFKYNQIEAEKKTKKEVDIMFRYYQKDGDEFYARTGKYMEKSYIGDDLQKCNSLLIAFENSK